MGALQKPVLQSSTHLASAENSRTRERAHVGEQAVIGITRRILLNTLMALRTLQNLHKNSEINSAQRQMSTERCRRSIAGTRARLQSFLRCYIWSCKAYHSSRPGKGVGNETRICGHQLFTFYFDSSLHVSHHTTTDTTSEYCSSRGPSNGHPRAPLTFCVVRFLLPLFLHRFHSFQRLQNGLSKEE